MAMEPPETIEVEDTTVGCDGGDEPLGHPLVYLTMSDNGTVDCPYCGRRYVFKKGAEGATGIV